MPDPDQPLPFFQRVVESWRDRWTALRVFSLAYCAQEVNYSWQDDTARERVSDAAGILLLPGLAGMIYLIVVLDWWQGLFQSASSLIREHNLIGPVIVFSLLLLAARIVYLLIKLLIRTVGRVLLFPGQLIVEIIRELAAGFRAISSFQTELSGWLDAETIRGVFTQAFWQTWSHDWDYYVQTETFFDRLIAVLYDEFFLLLPPSALEEIASRSLSSYSLSTLYRYFILNHQALFETVLPGLVARGFFIDPDQMKVFSQVLAELPSVDLAQTLETLREHDPHAGQGVITRLFQAAQLHGEAVTRIFMDALCEAPVAVCKAALAGLPPAKPIPNAHPLPAAVPAPAPVQLPAAARPVVLPPDEIPEWLLAFEPAEPAAEPIEELPDWLRAFQVPPG